MSNIVPITQMSLKTLSPDELAAIEAGQNKRIKDYGKEDLFKRVADIVGQLIYLWGERADKWTTNDQGVFAAELTTALTETFGTFTVEEILLASRAWSLGKLNQGLSEDEKRKDGIHISVHNLCKAIWYWREQTRQVAIEKAQKEQDEQEKHISEAEKEYWTQKFKDDIKSEWEQYKVSKSLNPENEYYHSAMYTHLEKLTREDGTFKYRLNVDTKTQIYNAAKLDIDARIRIESIREQIANTPEEETIKRDELTAELIRWQRLYPHVQAKHKGDFEITIETQCKQRARKMSLKYVFDWLINNGKELELN